MNITSRSLFSRRHQSSNYKKNRYRRDRFENTAVSDTLDAVREKLRKIIGVTNPEPDSSVPVRRTFFGKRDAELPETSCPTCSLRKKLR